MIGSVERVVLTPIIVPYRLPFGPVPIADIYAAEAALRGLADREQAKVMKALEDSMHRLAESAASGSPWAMR